MRVLTNLVFKVTLSSMIVTAPAMITGTKNDATYNPFGKEANLSFYSSEVIRNYVSHSTLAPAAIYREGGETESAGKNVFAIEKSKSVVTVANSAAAATVARSADAAVTVAKNAGAASAENSAGVAAVV